MADKLGKLIDEVGYVGLAKRATGYFYRSTIRRVLPTVGPVRYSGIPISMDRKLGDQIIPEFLAPYMGYDIPDYEATLIKGIRANVRSGDKVVVVGGGAGVTV